MFARFRLPDDREANVNVTLVRMFEPGATADSTRLHFTDGKTLEIPVTNRSVRAQFKKALEAGTSKADAE